MDKIRYAVCAFFLLLTACGVFTPHVAVDASLSGSLAGRVDTSGTTTITYDLSALTAWFTSQCQAELGEAATSEQVAACAAKATEGFLAAFGSTPQPSPSSGA